MSELDLICQLNSWWKKDLHGVGVVSVLAVLNIE